MKIEALKILGDTGKVYTISLRGEEPVCTCPAFLYNPGPCKHIKFVVASLAELVTA